MFTLVECSKILKPPKFVTEQQEDKIIKNSDNNETIDNFDDNLFIQNTLDLKSLYESNEIDN